MKLIGKTAATHAHFLVLKCPYSGRLRLLGIGKLTTSSHFGTSTHYNIPKIVYIFKNMRRFKIKTLITSIVGLAVFTILLGYLSSIVGWYGYKKWEYRVSSLNVEESKKRNVFVRKLNYKILTPEITIPDFNPFIEKGFKYGKHSSSQTVLIENSDYPYQLSFNYRPTKELTILIKNSNLKKFDSSDGSWGYLKKSYLKDTIFLNIFSNKQTGTIAVW